MIRKMIKRIIKLSGKYSWRIKGAFVFAVIEAILSKMPIYYGFMLLSRFYDNSITATDCLYVGIALVVTLLIQMIVHRVTDQLQSGAGYLLFADKRIELGNHLRKMPMGYFTEGNIGKISSVLSTDMAFIEENIMHKLGNIMSFIFSAAVMLLFMCLLDWRLGVIALVTTGVAVVVGEQMQKKVSAQESVLRQQQSELLTDAVLAFVEGIAVIKSYNLLGEKSGELRQNFKRSMDKNIDFESAMSPWIVGLFVVLAIGITGVFGMSIILTVNGELGLPYLLGVLLFVFEMFGPLKALYLEAPVLNIMNCCLDRIEAVLDEPELDDGGQQTLPQQAAGGIEVAFKNVRFGYGEELVLDDISCELKSQTMTALVGPSGGGKTTVANLLARFWDVRQGEIIIRGVDLKTVPLAQLMEQISMVFQRVYLFKDTIYNNIAMGRQDATREEVTEAARKARCYDFIMALPDGFDTLVGEGGASLSGGEKQRVSIARCILKDAPIVILDEATASVDRDNERYIQEAITELVKGKTLLVIAHRIHTIKNADQILLIADGRIVERGNHQQLLQGNGIYAGYIKTLNKKQQWQIKRSIV